MEVSFVLRLYWRWDDIHRNSGEAYETTAFIGPARENERLLAGGQLFVDRADLPL